ncbi:MAG: hypothetical protein CM1200mP39_30530 [Dehalococcoidia bacterium]|nr:MAG: hypothetical protein CM1200mP39_30530 [Dehalococcoidia bacterium]
MGISGSVGRRIIFRLGGYQHLGQLVIKDVSEILEARDR